MPRQARLNSPGTLHHVIVRGIGRKRIVDDDNDRQVFVSRLGGPKVLKVRGQSATELLETYGMSLAEIVGHVGVSTSAMSMAIKRVNGD